MEDQNVPEIYKTSIMKSYQWYVLQRSPKSFNLFADEDFTTVCGELPVDAALPFAESRVFGQGLAI